MKNRTPAGSGQSGGPIDWGALENVKIEIPNSGAHVHKIEEATTPTASEGGGMAMSLMQPSIALNYIIRGF